MRVRKLPVLAALMAVSACGSASGDAEAQFEVGDRPKSFAQCAACHSVEPGENGIGPTLAGVYGARAAHIGDFAYSSAMRESGLTWDEQTLDRYLENPRSTVPGTKMSYSGLRDPAKRAEIIAYLKTQ